MQNTSRKVGRRAVITAAGRQRSPHPRGRRVRPGVTAAGGSGDGLADVPLNASATITVERRADIALIGLNRPFIQNRLDPPTRAPRGNLLSSTSTIRRCEPSCCSATASSRAASTWTRRRRRSRRDGGRRAEPCSRPARQVPAASLEASRRRRARRHLESGTRIYLACDIRIAAANTRFGQDENTHGRFPGGATSAGSSAKPDGNNADAPC